MKSLDTMIQATSSSTAAREISATAFIIGLWACHSVGLENSVSCSAALVIGALQALILVVLKFTEETPSRGRRKRRSFYKKVVSNGVYFIAMACYVAMLFRWVSLVKEIRWNCIGLLGIPFLIDAAWRSVEQGRNRRRTLLYLVVVICGAVGVIASHILKDKPPVSVFFFILPFVLGFDDFVVENIMPDLKISILNSKEMRYILALLLLALSVYGVINPEAIGLVLKVEGGRGY